MNDSKIPYVVVHAKDHEEFGYKLGEVLAERIALRVKMNKKAYERRDARSFDELIERARKFLPAIKKKFPKLLRELECMSEGACVPFNELLVLNCEEEVLYYYVPHCTSIAVRTDKGEILVGHNDDWLEEYRKNGLYLVRAHIGSNSFLALSYMGSLPGTSCGINKFGVSFTVNSLDFKRFRFGVPRIFLLRQLLDAEDITGARKLVTEPWSSICANTLLTKGKTMEDVETLWCHHDIFRSGKWLIHTNHPLNRGCRNEKNTPKESLRRYDYVNNLLSSSPKINIDVLKEILKDHKTGICSHGSKRYHSSSTIASVIMNPQRKWMLVCHGGPCRGEYVKYTLNDNGRG